jgi:hypothetical protein
MTSAGGCAPRLLTKAEAKWCYKKSSANIDQGYRRLAEFLACSKAQLESVKINNEWAKVKAKVIMAKVKWQKIPYFLI